MCIVRIPFEGIEDFRAYEDAVLPLLPEFNVRRLRNPDGTIEMHIISFAPDADCGVKMKEAARNSSQGKPGRRGPG